MQRAMAYERAMILQHAKTFPQYDVYGWTDVPEQLLYEQGYIHDFNQHRLARLMLRDTGTVNHLKDFGVDGLAKLKETTIKSLPRFHLLQAKCYNEQSYLCAKDLGSFFFTLLNPKQSTMGYLYYTCKLQIDLQFRDPSHPLQDVPYPFPTVLEPASIVKNPIPIGRNGISMLSGHIDVVQQLLNDSDGKVIVAVQRITPFCHTYNYDTARVSIVTFEHLKLNPPICDQFIMVDSHLAPTEVIDQFKEITTGTFIFQRIISEEMQLQFTLDTVEDVPFSESCIVDHVLCWPFSTSLLLNTDNEKCQYISNGMLKYGARRMIALFATKSACSTFCAELKRFFSNEHGITIVASIITEDTSQQESERLLYEFKNATGFAFLIGCHRLDFLALPECDSVFMQSDADMNRALRCFMLGSLIDNNRPSKKNHIFLWGEHAAYTETICVMKQFDSSIYLKCTVLHSNYVLPDCIDAFETTQIQQIMQSDEKHRVECMSYMEMVDYLTRHWPTCYPHNDLKSIQYADCLCGKLEIKDDAKEKSEKLSTLIIEKIKKDIPWIFERNAFDGLNDAQKDAMHAFKRGKNIFLTGPGGTGKSYLFQKMYETLNPDTTAVCALTGMASQCLRKLRAKTLHSWAGMGKLGLPETLSIEVILNWKNVTHLFCDEVSMLTEEQFEWLDDTAKNIRRDERAFGGIQVVFGGDFYQLPPVVKHPQVLRYCFQSSRWSMFTPCLLTINKRVLNYYDEFAVEKQHRVTEFATMLGEIRVGVITPKTIGMLQSRVGLSLPEKFITKIFAKKDLVNAENEKHYSELLAKEHIFTRRETDHRFNPENATRICEELKELRNCIDKTIRLKKGAIVMCTKNISKYLKNGTQGTIVEFFDGLPIIEITIQGDPKQILIKEAFWPCSTDNKCGIYAIPLVHAWAISIHKSQGMTIPFKGLVDFRSMFADGQAYVALSRFQTLESMYILTFNPTLITASSVVNAYYNSITPKRVDEITSVNTITNMTTMVRDLGLLTDKPLDIQLEKAITVY